MRLLKAVIVILGFSSTVIADPFESYQWGLKNSGSPQMVDLDMMFTYRVPGRINEDVNLPVPYKAKKKILVAVLDTGIQKNHPDLKNIIHRNEDECRALEKFNACLKNSDRMECEKTWMNLNNPEVDKDKNGYPMDCQGWSLLSSTVNPDLTKATINPAGSVGIPIFDDSNGHGTHVSGIIAAEIGNNIGVRGLSENVEILPVQVLGIQPSQPIKPVSIFDSHLEEGRERIRKSLGDMVARGVIYAMRSGAQIINFSLGWPQAADSDFLRKVIEVAQSRGIIIVAAAGNDSTRALLRPCTYPNVICVGAAGPDGGLTYFSNYGSGVDVVGPGLNILSTYPESIRPARFKSSFGYEYLSGTSQATPYVTAAVAEMLARGVPASEIYARLVLGSRPIQKNLPLLEGGSHEKGRKFSGNEGYRKFTNGGNLDVTNALKVQAQPLIVLNNKEKEEIKWDRKSKNISFEFSLVNKWSDVDSALVKLNAYFQKPHPDAVRPLINSVKEIAPYSAVWKTGDVRKYVVAMSINDTSDVSQTRLPSELDLTLDVQIQGYSSRRFIVESEITVEANESLSGSDIRTFPLIGMPQGRFSYIPVDQNMDSHPEQRDYLALSDEQNDWNLWLISDSGHGSYNASNSVKIHIDGDSEFLLDKVTARLDMDDDGHSEYILGVIEDKSKAHKPSPMSFFVFDKSMKMKDIFKYDNAVAPMPLDATQIFWQKIGGTKRPAWIGGGKDPGRKQSLRDRWENPDNDEKPKVRFYYLNEKNQLKALENYQGFEIIDIIQPRQDQLEAGRVSILLARNKGTEAKPSYLYDFAIAEVIEGQVRNFHELNLFQDIKVYRNILDTSVNRVYSLDYQSDEFAGTYWFGEGLHRQQRFTLFDNKNMDLLDRQIGAQRPQFDSALKIKSAFSGSQRKGVFVITNSEIEYHDLVSGEVLSKSLERYTFFPDKLLIGVYHEITLQDSKNILSKLPGMFIVEGAGLSKGVRMLVPVFNRENVPVELISPARLRFKSAGCRSMETAVFDGRNGAHSFDYLCVDKIIRVNLNY